MTTAPEDAWEQADFSNRLLVKPNPLETAWTSVEEEEKHSIVLRQVSRGKTPSSHPAQAPCPGPSSPSAPKGPVGFQATSCLWTAVSWFFSTAGATASWSPTGAVCCCCPCFKQGHSRGGRPIQVDVFSTFISWIYLGFVCLRFLNHLHIR